MMYIYIYTHLIERTRDVERKEDDGNREQNRERER